MDRSLPNVPNTGVLMRRLLGGVIAAAVAFALTFRGLQIALGLGELPALLAATALTLVLVTAALAAVVRPLAAMQADLASRYAAAVADALRDPLTGLGNHRAFHEELDRQGAAALRYGLPLALLLIDLDEFKAINDGHGHAAGDRLLRAFGHLLATGIRRADRAFRVGGDEFAVILPHTGVEGARVVARRLLAQALQPTLRLEELRPISFSAGLSALPELADTGARLYAQADTALYVAKRGGRTDVATFDPAEQVALSPDIGAASSAVAEVIEHGRLAPVYQPIVELPGGRVLGVEGLIRPVPPAPYSTPGELFAAAETGGRTTALDLACIETIVAGAADLPADEFLTLNLSPTTLEAPEFSGATLLRILASHGFPPGRLVIELTERQAIHDPQRVRARMSVCRRAGVRFAADDVGAGNAGLRLLAEIRFDIIKVDLGLVQRSASGGLSGAVLGSVVELASRTGTMVIAEGIEEASQLPQLTAMGIRIGQGYLLGRPGPLVADGHGAIEPVPAAVGVAAWRASIGLPTVS